MIIRENIMAVLVIIFVISLVFMPEIVDYLLIEQNTPSSLMDFGVTIWLVAGISLIIFLVISAYPKKLDYPKKSDLLKSS